MTLTLLRRTRRLVPTGEDPTVLIREVELVPEEVPQPYVQEEESLIL